MLDPRDACYGMCSPLIIPGDHPGPDTEFLQFRNCFCARRLDRIRNGNNCPWCAINGQDHCGLAIFLEPTDDRVSCRIHHALLRLPEIDVPAADMCGDPGAG